MSFPSRVSAGFAGLFVGAVACSGAFSGTELDGGAEAGPPVPSTTVPPPGPEADSALPDAPAEAAAEGGACVVLTLDPTSKLGPVLSGRARVEGGTLTLLPGDPFAFNQSGTAVFSFPPSTKVKGAFAVVVGRPPSSGYGDGAALAFYPSAPGAPSRGLFGLAAGPAAIRRRHPREELGGPQRGRERVADLVGHEPQLARALPGLLLVARHVRSALYARSRPEGNRGKPRDPRKIYRPESRRETGAWRKGCPSYRVRVAHGRCLLRQPPRMRSLRACGRRARALLPSRVLHSSTNPEP